MQQEAYNSPSEGTRFRQRVRGFVRGYEVSSEGTRSRQSHQSRPEHPGVSDGIYGRR
jgi:hypothetical protein